MQMSEINLMPQADLQNLQTVLQVALDEDLQNLPLRDKQDKLQPTFYTSYKH